MSKIEVNTVAPQCGTTLTLGESGDTVVLGTGASQSGFGRTGTVDWQTGDIKTSTFTAESGKGYFCDTNGGPFELDLPAGSAGAIVSLQDYRNTFDDNSLTVDPNGSEKINGGDAGAPLTLSTEGQGLTLVYIDSTIGWRSVQDNTFSTVGQVPAFVTATGGTETIVCTNFKVHTFTGPGTFAVSCAGNASGSNTVSYMVIAGGGGGGAEEGGGGGAGGFRESKATTDSYTASPLNATTGAGFDLPVTATSFPITVGGGGNGQTASGVPATTGNPSTFSSITSTGGGRGGGQDAPQAGTPGGSGGGGHGDGSGNPFAGGSGNVPSTTPAQGKDGGNGVGRTGSTNEGAGGGGGATQAGSDGSTSPNPGGTGGPGGDGATTSITGSPVTRAGGGGGAATAPGGVIGTGGAGGGGNGTKSNPSTGGAGTINTGSGGGGGGGNGGAGPASKGGGGGSGIVVIRYRFQ